MISKKIKIAYLFGAGAEGKGNFNLPMGVDFLNETFFSNEESMYDSLESFFKGKTINIDNDEYTYIKRKLNTSSTYRKILSNYFESIKENKSSLYSQHDLKINEFLEGNLNSVIVKEYIACFKDLLTYNGPQKEKKKEEIDLQIKNTIFESLFIHNDNSNKYESRERFPVSNILDQYFYTIINPQKVKS